jgi:CheY-like chemotaxis protein
MGIDTGQLQSVFEMFVQLDTSRAQSAGGLGLGLALVKSLVELHHGSVEARSAGPGRGAEFVVRLPLKEPARQRDQPSLVVVGQERAANRILVVDDNEDAARTLGELLRRLGHEVHLFFDAEKALADAAGDPPDVAFVDLNMPGIDGFEMARRMRRTTWGAHICLVAVTGMGRENDVSQALDAGFDAHLTKPADPDKLLAFAQNGPPPARAAHL